MRKNIVLQIAEAIHGDGNYRAIPPEEVAKQRQRMTAALELAIAQEREATLGIDPDAGDHPRYQD